MAPSKPKKKQPAEKKTRPKIKMVSRKSKNTPKEPRIKPEPDSEDRAIPADVPLAESSPSEETPPKIKGELNDSADHVDLSQLPQETNEASETPIKTEGDEDSGKPQPHEKPIKDDPDGPGADDNTAIPKDVIVIDSDDDSDDDDLMIIDPNEVAGVKFKEVSFSHHAQGTAALGYGRPRVKVEDDGHQSINTIPVQDGEDKSDGDFVCDQNALLSDGEDEATLLHRKTSAAKGKTRGSSSRSQDAELDWVVTELERKNKRLELDIADLEEDIKKDPNSKELKSKLAEVRDKLRANMDEIEGLAPKGYLEAAPDFWRMAYKNAQNPVPKRGKRKRAATSGGKSNSAKRQKGGSGKVNSVGSSKEKDLAKLRVSDPKTALVEMDPDRLQPGAIRLNTQTTAWRQANEITQLRRDHPAADPKNKDEKAVKDFARRSFGFRRATNVGDTDDPQRMRWQLKGFATTLYNHQLIGVSWMIGRECSPNGPHGGILADDMGLGKTVQALACIALNPPTPADQKQEITATLIVVPSAAVIHWANEIERHLSDKPLIYRKSSCIPLTNLKNSRIILTTASELTQAAPNVRKKNIGLLSDERWKQEIVENCGDLFKMTFHRVIIDEAHMMKDRSSKKMFPYLDFIGVDRGMTYRSFVSTFGEKGSAQAQARLETVKNAVMLHRKKTDTFLGSVIVHLPGRASDMDYMIELSDHEFFIYRQLEERIRHKINKELEDSSNGAKMFLADDSTEDVENPGAAGEGPKTGNVKISAGQLATPLRRLTSHPFLGDHAFRQKFDAKQLEEITKALPGDTKDPPVKFLHDCFSILRDDVKSRAPSPEKEIKCALCRNPPEDPCAGPCNHVFCRSCFEDKHYEQMTSLAPKTFVICPTSGCGTKIHKAKDVKVESKSKRSGKSSRSQKKGKQPEKGVDINGISIIPLDENELLQRCDSLCDRKVLKGVVDSAKLSGVMNLVKEWQKAAPDDKIIIYTEWHHFSMILGRKLSEEKIGFLYYSSMMSLPQRNKAISDFKEKQEAKVFVVGFRCGNVALNLTSANRVILTDLWWNKAMEEQAFCRVDRIGQTKPVHFARFITKYTIDERMVELQDQKLREVNVVMGSKDSDDDDDDEAQADPEIEDRWLASLFGACEDLPDGTYRIVDDYEKRVQEERKNPRGRRGRQPRECP